MAREQVEAASKEEVLTALGDAASRLREKLGESLASIQKFDVPLAEATTSSLEALHAYSLALDEGTANPAPRGDSAPEAGHRARSRFRAGAGAARHGLRQHRPDEPGAGVCAQGVRAARPRQRARAVLHLVALLPRCDAGLGRGARAGQVVDGDLSARGVRLQQPRRGAQPLRPVRAGDRAARRVHSTRPAVCGGLLQSGRGVSRVESCRRREDGAAAGRGSEGHVVSDPAHRLSAGVPSGDTATMARLLEASVGVGQTNAAYGWQAHSSAFSGRVRAAHEQFRRGVQMASQGGFREVAAQLAVEDAEVHAMVGQCAEARAEVSAACRSARDNFSLERASRVLALCGRDAEAAGLQRELRERFPDATLTMRVSVARHDRGAWRFGAATAARALELLEPVQAVRSRADGRVLAGVPARPGVPGRRTAGPPASSSRASSITAASTRIAAVSARAPRRGPCGRARRRRRRRPARPTTRSSGSGTTPTPTCRRWWRRAGSPRGFGRDVPGKVHWRRWLHSGSTTAA